ncbi:MAG: ligand-binding sensor domain-containing protein, partial [Patiriisocius sp.]
TMFPQIHSNLNGLVSQFVRTMYQDSKGVFWFGTNGDGLIRYDRKRLEEFTKKDGIGTAIRKIAEDSIGRVWFGSV